jgi:alpha-tubulin suppressor-like RCC1 family protein
MKTGFQRPSDSNVSVLIDIGDPYPGREELLYYYPYINPAFEIPTIKSWGGDNYGQLGISSTGNVSVPNSVGALSNWRVVSAGGLHAAAVKTDGTIWCWGNNAYGQLGNNDITLVSKSSPVQVGALANWRQISAGYTHTVAIANDGNLWAWGSNLYGQLGIIPPMTTSIITTTGAGTWTSPTSWDGSNNKIEVIGGGGGGNIASGGGGGGYSAIYNVSLATSTAYNFNVAIGGTSTKNGQDTWFGGTSLATSLVSAKGGVSGGTRAGGSAAAGTGNIKYSGGAGGLATFTNNGGAGGGGAAGPGGNGATGGSNAGFQGGGGGGGNGGGFNGNTAVADQSGGRGGNGYIASGTYSAGGAPGAFGYSGSAGTLGSGGGGAGGYSGGFAPGAQVGGAGGNGIDIFSTYGSGGGGGGSGVNVFTASGPVGANGGLYGGGGGGGYTGGGTAGQGLIAITYPLPYAVNPIQVGTDNTWQQISSGGYHTMAIKSDGTLWGWGLNSTYQTGLITLPSLPTPTQINFPSLSWTAVSCGWQHSLGITSTGELYSWGWNLYGQLAQNDTAYRQNPTVVGSATNWKSISARGVSSAAIDTEHSMYTWGWNGQTNLGLGDFVHRSSPVQLGALNNWSSVSMGLYNGAAIRTDGSMWTWGYNASGELGLGTSGGAAYSTTPVQIGQLTNWKSVSVGGAPVDALGPVNGSVNIVAQGFTLSIVSATDF